MLGITNYCRDSLRLSPSNKQLKPEPIQEGESAAELTQTEKRQARERTALRAAVIHEAIRAEGEGELRRPVTALIWSGVAAGLSMGLSLVATGVLRAHLPDTSWRPLVVNLGYSVGFLTVILGRQQLFTENTLTVILPLLTRRDSETLRKVIRLWVVVLAANLVGAFLFAWGVSASGAFDESTLAAFHEIGMISVSEPFFTSVFRAVFAGWIIATMVWMMPAADSSRPAIIIVMTYLVGIAQLPHVIAGAAEVLYLVVSGSLSWAGFFGRFLVPTLIGNVAGGVALVAFFNHAQVVTEE